MTSYKGISLGVNNSKVVEKKEKKRVSKGHESICWLFFLGHISGMVALKGPVVTVRPEVSNSFSHWATSALWLRSKGRL